MAGSVVSPALLHACGDALRLVCVLSAPPLLLVLAVAVLMGLLQAATQVQDATVGAVPRLLAFFAALILFGAGLTVPVVRFAHLALTSFSSLR
jgi:type III secretory pathway component EscS